MHGLEVPATEVQCGRSRPFDASGAGVCLPLKGRRPPRGAASEVPVLEGARLGLIPSARSVVPRRSERPGRAQGEAAAPGRRPGRSGDPIGSMLTRGEQADQTRPLTAGRVAVETTGPTAGRTGRIVPERHPVIGKSRGPALAGPYRISAHRRVGLTLNRDSTCGRFLNPQGAAQRTSSGTKENPAPYDRRSSRWPPSAGASEPDGACRTARLLVASAGLPSVEPESPPARRRRS